ncbi:hypothetical protein BDQ17DRAFT_1436979 [Cyathus striatus]|nr:hypothetical protein BDQ17DRAFT_1436979 [Cyathus striatus]
MATQNSKPFRVAIIGAGIGGLALAVSLTRFIPEGAIQVDIYEQMHEIKEIGAGIFCWPRTWGILQRLGLSEALERLLDPDRKPDTAERTLIMKVIKSDRKESVKVLDFYKNGKPSSYHRADMQKTMLDSLPSSVGIHLAHRIVSYDEHDDKVIMNFENRLRRNAIYSLQLTRLPDQVESINPVWSGSVMYRSLIDASKLREKYPNHISFEEPIQFIGVGKTIVSYPIVHGRYINFAANVTDYRRKEPV